MSRARGIDISYYDISFDPSKATEPIDFVIQRTGYGLMVDKALDTLYPGVSKVPIRGAYHYLSTGIPWQVQAERFISLVADRKYHFYVCDFESAYNAMSIKFAMEANQWMDYVARKTGKPVLLYTNPNLYDLYAWHYCSSWPLWIAQYWLFPSPDKNPGMPKKRNAWNIWQYSADRNGKSRAYGCGANSVDINVYNGTAEEMRAWLKLDEAQPIQPPPPPVRDRKCPFEKCPVDGK